MRQPRPLRMVHTSDVHLGAYDSGGTASGRGHDMLKRAAFSRVVDLADESGADVLVIAGDFFDHDRVHEETVAFAASEIARFPGRTYILPGNHDAIDPGRLYWRYDMEAIAPRLRILRDPSGECVEDPDLDLVVWGRAHLGSDFGFRPLDNMPQRLDARWHLALAHGHFHRDSADDFRQLLIHREEIEAASGHWDYIALGHWDSHTDISQGAATAIYSGTPCAHYPGSKHSGWASVVDFGDEGVRWRKERVCPRGPAVPD